MKLSSAQIQHRDILAAALLEGGAEASMVAEELTRSGRYGLVTEAMVKSAPRRAWGE